VVGLVHLHANTKTKMETPKRIFKLATQVEADAFQSSGQICSSLDQADGFIHLSDRSSAPVVARLFFTAATDLVLIEVDAEKLPGTCEWVVGKMDDAAPSMQDRTADSTVVHYLLPDGCVHVYGAQGVPVTAVVRQERVPYNSDTKEHDFPTWL
jgi:uncharacterized protein (DUF952 family)